MLGTGGLGGALEESQRRPLGAGGQSILDPNFGDLQKVALGPTDSKSRVYYPFCHNLLVKASHETNVQVRDGKIDFTP